MSCATVIILLEDAAHRRSLVDVLTKAKHVVYAYGTLKELAEQPPKETCDLIVIGHTTGDPQGLARLADMRAMAPEIPAIISGYNLDLPAFVRALRLGVIAVVDPDDGPQMLEKVAEVRRSGAMVFIKEPARDALGRMLIQTVEALEQAARTAAEQERLRWQTSLAAREAQLHAHEKQLNDLRAQLADQAARRGGMPNAAGDWQQVERLKVRLEAQQRNLLTEKIVLQEEIDALKKKVEELTPYRAAFTRMQGEVAHREQELATFERQLRQRERELAERESMRHEVPVEVALATATGMAQAAPVQPATQPQAPADGKWSLRGIIPGAKR
jgi:FixJ family two-component response regulator